jgi:hypothetical protein
VFPRDPSPDIEDIVETIKVEAKNPDLAVALLEMQIEKYGQLGRIHWWPGAPVREMIEIGQRVWVADQSAEGGRAKGVVGSLSEDLAFSGGFVVLLANK